MENLNKFERVFLSIFIGWFFVHTIFFFLSTDGVNSSTFWPFTPNGLGFETTYDISEYLIYVGVPIVLMIIYRLVKPKKYADTAIKQTHANVGFFIAFLDEKINVEALTQQLNELTGKPIDNTVLQQLQKDRDIAGTQGVKNWIERVAVKEKYKDFERVYK